MRADIATLQDALAAEGVRSEINVFVDAGKAVVTGEPVQTAVVAILGAPAAA